MASMGSLVMDLTVSAARTQEDMGRLAQVVKRGFKQIDNEAARTSDNIANIGRAGKRIGKVEGAEQAAKSIEKIGHTSVAARREMLVLAHELSQGNFKKFGGSLMVLGEQMDLMGKVMSPVGLAIAGVTLAVGLLAVAFIHGAEESTRFNNAMKVTGGIAGVTEQQFRQMAEGIGQAAHASTSTSHEILQGLVDTGRFGPQALESVGVAATRFAVLTGQKGEEVVKEFEKVSDGALKWGLEMNRHYHFMDGALYDRMALLTKEGKEEKATQTIMEAFTASMGGRQSQDVDNFAASWSRFKIAFSNAVNQMLDFGRDQTVEQRIAAIQKQLELARAHPEVTMGEFGPHDPKSRVPELNKQLGSLTATSRNQQLNAELVAEKKTANDIVVNAKEKWKHLLETAKIGQQTLQDKLDENARTAKLADGSAADLAKLQEKTRKEFADKGALGVAHAETQAATKPIADQITAEEKLLQYRERVLDQYYKADKLSIEGYYETRRTVIEAEQVRIAALYDREIAITENAAKRSGDARTRIEGMTKANELRDQKNAALLASGEQLQMLDIAQAEAVQKYKDEVTKLVVELDKLRHTQSNSAGENFDREHADLLKKATVKNDTGTLQKLADARDAAVAQMAINNLNEQAKNIEADLGVIEARNQLLMQTGQESELEGLYKISRARADAAVKLAGIAQQEQDVADKSGLPELITGAQQFTQKVNELQSSSNVLGKTFNDIFASSFSQFIRNAVNGTKSLKENFLDMANAIEQAITDIVAKDLAAKLFGGASSGGSDGGGLFGQLAGLAMSYFGGAGGGGAGLASGTTSGVNSYGFTIPGRASGGPTIAGGLYQVNERGPELLTVANRTFLMMGDQPGKVTPVGSASGGGRQTFNMNIAVPPGTTRQSAQQQAAEIMRHAQIAMARNS